MLKMVRLNKIKEKLKLIKAKESFQKAEIIKLLAKESSKNRHPIFKEELKYALEKNQFSLFYQPHIETATGRIRGFEALLRWNHPELGEVSPMVFIPIAEEMGLINAIGKWVLQKACEKNREIQISYLPDSIMSVNISGKQLNDPFLFEYVMETLQKYSMSPLSLELEITESTQLSFIDQEMNTLKRLAYKGIRISLDDFGMEYATLQSITMLPLSTVKIDRSFISKMSTEAKCKIVTEWIISLANKLGLMVIAEGVESYEQLYQLQQWKCNCIQGYLLSKPLCEKDIPSFFAKFEWRMEKKLYV